MTDTSAPPRRMTTKTAMTWMLILQLSIAGFLMGRDILVALPSLAFPSTQPQFDTPIVPGDQTRRFRQGDTPLDGNPARPFQSTGDMPSRLLFEVDGDTLTLTGQIAPGDADRFDDYLEVRRNFDRVRLNSPGGSVQDALAIGRRLRADEENTMMGAADICLSACPYMLASGVERTIHEDAQVGVHQHFFDANVALPAFIAVEDIQRGQGEVMAYLDEMGVDPRLMQHALVTPPDEIYVLLPEQLVEYRMTTQE